MARRKTDMLDELKSSAEKIWLAGLGALAQAEKQGDKLFKSLVEKGKKYEDVFPSAGDALKESVTAAKQQANRTFGEVEAAFDRQVANAVRRAGLARQSEVDALKKEVAKLKRAAKGGRAVTQKKTAKKKTGTKKKKSATRKRTT